MSRWKAAGIHFLISLVIATVAVGAVVLIMYPPPYTRTAGAGKLLVTLIGVDVTLGPLITLIIFKHGKPGLKFDLTVIAMLQIAALCYGLYMIAQARPVFLTFAIDRFVLIQANAIPDEAMAQAEPPFNRKSWTGPMLVAADPSANSNQSYDILTSALGGGPDIDSLPQFYVSYESRKELVRSRAKPLEYLAQRSDGGGARARAWLDQRGAGGDYLYLPLQTRGSVFHTLVVDQASADPIDVLRVDPW